MARKKFSKKQVAAKYGFRSGLEMKINESLTSRGIDGQYEQNVIEFIKPVTKHKYRPDFRLPNGIFVETKGRFLAADRKKHLLIKEQCPELDIRFLFQNSKAKISKNSKTTYATWCEKNGFLYADKDIPEEWFN
jgi:hypothetical protein